MKFNHNHFLSEVGLLTLAGESDRSALEKLWSRPTCEINGMKSGYIDEGFKTVLPSQASAKISFRLVSNQDPIKISNSFREMVKSLIPSDCKVSFGNRDASKASQMNTSSPEFEKARQAISQEWDIEAAFIGAVDQFQLLAIFRKLQELILC